MWCVAVCVCEHVDHSQDRVDTFRVVGIGLRKMEGAGGNGDTAQKGIGVDCYKCARVRDAI